MKFTHTALAATLAFGIPALTVPAFAQQPGHSMVNPVDLKWSDVPSLPPGAKIAVIEGPITEPVPFTFRLKMPANYQIPAHYHPAAERVTVLNGTFNMGVGDKLDRNAATALPPGGLMILPARTPHYAWTGKDEVIVQLNGTGPWGVTYVDPATDPRKQ